MELVRTCCPTSTDATLVAVGRHRTAHGPRDTATRHTPQPPHEQREQQQDSAREIAN